MLWRLLLRSPAPSRSSDLSAQRQETVRRLTAPDIAARKGGDPIVCLTAYTAPVAEILDDHCDLLLVGDSVGMVVHGLPNTVGVTLEMMILHGQAVMRASKKAMVVVDMPFGSYEGTPERAYDNASRIMKETGAQGVKVEAASRKSASLLTSGLGDLWNSATGYAAMPLSGEVLWMAAALGVMALAFAVTRAVEEF